MERISRKEITLEKYTAPDGKLIIEPFKHMERSVVTTDFEMKPAPEGVDPTSPDYEPEYVPVKTKSKAPFEIQLAKVVAAGEGTKFNVGDIVVYSIKFVKEFDLFKDTLLISEYDVQGKMAL